MSYKTKDIRNVVLLGHSGAGKTTLTECMLFEAGEVNRRGSVLEGNTKSDYTNIEKERKNSIFSSALHVSWKDSKINIIDTPGYDDFIGEVISSLKVADTALMVVNAVNGVEVGTELIWEYTKKYQTPSIFVVNQIDHEKADFDLSLEQIQDRFGSNAIPIQYPLGKNKIVDALRMVVYHFPDEGGKPTKEDIPETELNKAQTMHNALVEVAAENDEGLMEKFFDEGTLNEEELAQGLTIALANHEFYPVFCCSAEMNMGSGRIMGFINDIAPSPADRPKAQLEDGSSLAPDSNDATSVFIYKTISEPRIGAVSYFKVYSGELKSGDELVNTSNRTTERFNQIFLSNGKERVSAESLCAGDLGVTVKLKNSHTNQTMSTKGTSREIEKISFPESRIRTAIVPPGKNDMEKLMKALHVIEEEDPTLKVEQSPRLKQTILHGQGQLHLDLIKYRIEKVNNVSMEFEKPRIPYLETITKSINDSYRHKKQSGGSGQFGEVHARFEPYYEGMPEPSDLNVRFTEEEELDWGGKLVFKWCIVGGAIDSKFSNAIKKGIMLKMMEGPLTGSYCTNLRVCIYDGKMHPVDSNDMAFQIAASMIFKNSFTKAGPQLLEPIYDLEILCSSDSMGDIMGDLQSRRAMILGMDSEGHYQKIMVKVPLSELYQYSSTLRSISQGRAKFTRKFAEYQAVTSDIQKKLISNYQKELEAV